MTTQSTRRDRFEQMAGDVFEPLQRYLRRRAPVHDAEDVLSEVLLAVWKRIEDVPAEHPLPWCYGIARRALANHRRGDRRQLRVVARLSSEPPHRRHPLHHRGAIPDQRTGRECQLLRLQRPIDTRVPGGIRGGLRGLTWINSPAKGPRKASRGLSRACGR